MRKFYKPKWVCTWMMSIISVFTLFTSDAIGQCNTSPGTVSGVVFDDTNANGIRDLGEPPIDGVVVTVDGAEIDDMATAISGRDGSYSITGLEDGTAIRLMFDFDAMSYTESQHGRADHSAVQFAQVPQCGINLSLATIDSGCESSPELFLTCFVREEVDNARTSTGTTILGIPAAYSSNRDAYSVATHGELGSVWGIAYKDATDEIFSASFVKQYAGLKDGHGAIFRTVADGSGGYTTSNFVNLTDLGVTMAPLQVTDVMDCDYGQQVGKYGLGAMVLSPSGQDLFVVNISENQIVKIDTEDPSAATTYNVPDPGCGSHRAFALEWYNDRLFVGVTCTQEQEDGSAEEKDQASSAVIYNLDTESGAFEHEFTTDYIDGHWGDYGPSSSRVAHWLTDISFTGEGNMVLGISDRVGHRYCDDFSGVLHGQFPDILMVHRQNGAWVLENNGSAGELTGSGVGNGQGPGGGEFFGDDFWPANPVAHPEVALGSVFSVPGTDMVVATVFDPDQESYSGGLHTYSATTGELLNKVELYSYSIDVEFGKATGFGGITSNCMPLSVQIGNYVWDDANNNGEQDAGEGPVPGLDLVLYDNDCNIVGSTTTDVNGNYSFGQSNVSGTGITPGGQYYIGIADTQLDAAAEFVTISNTNYIISAVGVDDATGNDASLGTRATCGSQVVVPVTAPAAGTNDYSFDIGLSSNLEFDLALRKMVVSNPYVRAGDLVDFEIEVFNQGNYSAKDIIITDFIPSSMTFDETLNPAWELGERGMITYRVKDKLSPGTSTTVALSLTVDGGGTDYINVAEISDASDLQGGHPTDTDSSYDSNPDNDNGGDWNTASDDEISDTGAFDEDDHDPASVVAFDLALKYELVGSIRRHKGESVEFLVSVYNQGNVTADEYDLIVYNNPDLEFDAIRSQGWNEINGSYRMFIQEDLEPGQSKSYSIFLDISRESEESQLVQYAEISRAVALHTLTLSDFDSDPDANPSNDIGGEINTLRDNLLSDNGAIDEDDHDPAYVIVDVVDLALVKQAVSTAAVAGEVSTFEITITNQGTVPVYAVDVIDYLPEGLSLQDPDWNDKGGSVATRTLAFTDGLGYNQSHTTTISTLVDVDAPTIMINVAEITGYRDQNDADLSRFDIDSRADDIPSNDIGGQVNTSMDNNIGADPRDDEDDQDPAMLVLSAFTLTRDSCLANATTSMDGLFLVEFEVTSSPGSSWSVVSSSNIYDAASTPGSLVDLDGTFLGETGVNSGVSTYTLTAVYQDGIDYSFDIEDNNGTTMSYSGTASVYPDINIAGERSLCAGATTTYTASGLASGDYTWTLPNGGTLLSGQGTPSVSVQWPNATGIAYAVEASSTDPTSCIAPASLPVGLGTGGATMSCYGSLNISLNHDCEIVVTPQTISSTPIDPNDGFSVMLLLNGEAIPGNTLTDVHIGKQIAAKLIDGCGSNSCWTTITVEDKMAPTVQVPDTVFVSCTDMPTYMPQAMDNCNNPVSSIVETFRTETRLHCDSNYVLRADVAYVATDIYGNASQPTSTIILVERPQLDSMVFPPNLMDTLQLTCGTFDTVGVGFPAIEETGYPRLGNIDLVPGIDLGICNIGVSSSIRRMGKIDCTTKYARDFTIYEAWCSNGVLLQYTQIIEVLDDSEPVFDNIPDDFSALANSATCMASLLLPTVTATDGCLGDQADIIVRVNGAIETSPIATLPIGMNEILYFASDDCGNRDSIRVMVDVDYLDGPTVICDQETVVAINAQGVAYAYASTFDDGSFVGCGSIDSMKVRRVGDVDTCGFNSTTYTDFVEFCCEEVGDSVMVELAVWDDNGNSNSCMVSVFVQDAIPPVITSCPSDITRSCMDDFSDLTVFGMPTAVDQCSVTIQELDPIDNRDGCGVGTIMRRFIAFDQTDTVTCDQVITIEYQNPYAFDPVRDSFPADLDTMLCDIADLASLTPDNLPVGFGAPIIRAGGTCSNVGVGFRDTIFTTFPSDTTVLAKVLRTWTIVDSCSSNPDFIVFVGQQTIKVTRQEVCDFMDVALIKQLNTVQTQLPVRINDLVTFDITVCNQGNTIVEQVEVVDYIPTGLTLSDANWTLTGNMATRNLTPGAGLPVGGLLPDVDSCAVTTITLSINADASPSTVLNYAEIKSSTDENGDTVDADSTPDMNPDNDGDVFPGDPHDDSLEDGPDEDDYDVADVPLFDLALRKTTSATPPFALGDVVTFDIEVINQGNVDATDVEVTDYIPCGFSLSPSSTAWVLNSADNTATTTIPSIVVAGAVTVSIDLVIEACNDTDAYINVAEISAARDGDGNPAVDIDSNADSTANNDNGGQAGTNTDNTVNNENGDEDDADPAVIVLTYCDICPGLTLSSLPNITRGVIPGQCDTVVNIPVPQPVANPCGELGVLTFTTQYENDAPVAGVGDNASGSFQAGTTTVTYTLTSICNMTGVQQSFTVTVLDDDGPVCNPDPIVHPVITITNGAPVATLDTQFLLSQFTDLCSGVAPNITLSQGTFDCNDALAGSVTFDVTVEDVNGNATTCTASVVVNEEIAPVCNAIDISVNLDASGSATILGSDIVPTPIDECGTVVSVTVMPDAFDCSNVGPNTVTVSITDDSGNVTANCTAIVTVVDTIGPECNPDPIVHPVITITNGAPVATLDTQFLLSQFSDVCGTVDPNFIVLSQGEFGCADAQSSPVVFTVTVQDNSGNSTTCTASVTIEEDIAPTCNAQDVTVYLDAAGDGSTSGSEIVPNPVDDCGMVTLVEVTPFDFDCSNLGPNTVTVNITDDNGNVTQNCTATVTVVDTIAPVCNLRDITVSLTGTSVSVDFSQVDNGTFDNCGNFTTTPTAWSFDCTDLGPNMVTVLVTDDSQNTTTCTATITVEDDTQPLCSTVDTTVYLNGGGVVNIDPSFVNNGSSLGCGGVPTLGIDRTFFGCQTLGPQTVTLFIIDGMDTVAMCPTTVTVLDTLKPTITFAPVVDVDCSEFETNNLPTISSDDNCASFTPLVIVDTLDTSGLNVCGIGTIVRTYTATDGSGNSETVTQIINVGNDDPFTIDDITFPVADTTITCEANGGMTPSAGTVTIDTADIDCALVTVTDTSFFSNPGSCPDTLVTIWNIVDSCQFDGVFDLVGPGEFQFRQRIAIIDTTAPVINFPLANAGDTLFFFVDTLPCELFLSFPATVMDCSPLDTVFNDSPHADNPASASPNGTYPVGIYDITITARDECQNESTFEYVVSVQDTNTIEYRCVKLFVDIPDTLSLEVSANDFLFITDLGCNDPSSLTASFGPAIGDSLSTFSCGDLGDSTIFLQVYIDGQLVEDSCKTLITIEDPGMFCPSTRTMASINGDVLTVRGTALPQTYVELEGGEVDDMTDAAGHFAFGDMPVGGDYMVKPYNNNDPRLGVSTLDMILIQRHILGLQRFDDPYSYLAADINDSESLTGSDVVELRQLILGITGEFSNNTSWKMVDAYQTFDDPSEILYEAREDKLILDLQYDVVADFTAVKIGDVNGSVDVGLRGDRLADSRSATWLETELVDGQIVFTASRDLDMRGLQLVLNVPGLIDVEAVNIDIATDDYYYDNEKLAISWINASGTSIQAGDALFAISQDADKLSRSYTLADDIPSEVYLGEQLDVVPVELRSAALGADMSLIKNAPNPWSDMTEIGVVVSETSQVQIVISDVAGKVVKTMTETCYPGVNKVIISRSDLHAAGLYYYTVTDGKSTMTQKMILLD